MNSTKKAFFNHCWWKIWNCLVMCKKHKDFSIYFFEESPPLVLLQRHIGSFWIKMMPYNTGLSKYQYNFEKAISLIFFYIVFWGNFFPQSFWFSKWPTVWKLHPFHFILNSSSSFSAFFTNEATSLVSRGCVRGRDGSPHETSFVTIVFSTTIESLPQLKGLTWVTKQGEEEDLVGKLGIS